MECYREFAHIYDELINEDIDYEKWAKTITNICDDFNLCKIDYLDLACGTGNLTLQVSPYFKNMWAVDLSYDMLTEAENKFRENNIKGKLVCQNICDLKLNKTFNLITCCLDGINYILDKKSLNNLFENVYNHLKEDGLFIFDINSYYKLNNILGNNLFSYDDDEITYIWRNSTENNITNMDITFFIREDENNYIRFDEEHKERAYKEEEIEEIILNNGFKILKTLDNYENKKIQEKTERIVYILTK
ncbi:class I SAM-dependent DNA methyltransferase [Clostridium botulinum]|uniref:class I SAM-dependent DNA methyltransferase n=1 Tax=Clostridium botulinum TaxID=1491 RepID=UPI0004D02A05|nr:class I SAM-dependent methyltransferase [Clostridium botulinum]APC85185.1 ubiE/COQ5 methyltransferase family protein [Clostridium botulinum]AXG97149.1 class I SAM-dependent methyltransferase [Clostridium botulinum]MBY6773446.1 class I SAM-dependent methyltransferase [Clostridium botulinum]MBY6776840.1 class I SAM-dependent methyltransferase [Clostridium botulinum]MBY6782924.1 class I SAM-dependent methyltransferase [Clostridium botulinum]